MGYPLRDALPVGRRVRALRGDLAGEYRLPQVVAFDHSDAAPDLPVEVGVAPSDRRLAELPGQLKGAPVRARPGLAVHGLDGVDRPDEVVVEPVPPERVGEDDYAALRVDLVYELAPVLGLDLLVDEEPYEVPGVRVHLDPDYDLEVLPVVCLLGLQPSLDGVVVGDGDSSEAEPVGLPQDLLRRRHAVDGVLGMDVQVVGPHFLSALRKLLASERSGRHIALSIDSLRGHRIR